MVILQPGSLSAGQIVHAPNTQLVLQGITAAEAAASATTAEFIVYHGTDTSGPMLIAPANFAADGFMYPTFFPNPIPVPNGLYIEIVSGTVVPILYIDYQ